MFGIVDVGWGFNGISRVREGISTLYTSWIINTLHRSRRRCGLVVAGNDKFGHLETPNSRRRVEGSVKARKGARQTSRLDHSFALPPARAKQRYSVKETWRVSESNQPSTVLLGLSRSQDTERGWGGEGREQPQSASLSRWKTADPNRTDGIW